MRLWAFSDTHFCNGLSALRGLMPAGIPDADVAVIAGDLIEGDPADAVSLLDDLIAPLMPVVFVLGNHEFYNHGCTMVVNRGRAARAAERTDGRVHVLDDGVVDIGGLRFIWSTLWTDLEIMGSDPASMAYASRAVAESLDRQIVHDGDEPWTPSLARQQHLQSRAWLDEELGKSNLPTIVVTHHAPHRGSIADRFARDWATAGYASDLSELIERHRPPLWIHGHMHESFDYVVGETRIVCNPKGYGRENAAGFDPGRVIEL